MCYLHTYVKCNKATVYSLPICLNEIWAGKVNVMQLAYAQE